MLGGFVEMQLAKCKLLRQLEIMRETWIALKFNDEIFVVWKELVFLYLKNCENKPSKE
jgi:hypothetical protein